jgi:hypothetical protein
LTPDRHPRPSRLRSRAHATSDAEARLTERARDHGADATIDVRQAAVGGIGEAQGLGREERGLVGLIQATSASCIASKAARTSLRAWRRVASPRRYGRSLVVWNRTRSRAEDLGVGIVAATLRSCARWDRSGTTYGRYGHSCTNVPAYVGLRGHQYVSISSGERLVLAVDDSSDEKIGGVFVGDDVSDLFGRKHVWSTCATRVKGPSLPWLPIWSRKRGSVVGAVCHRPRLQRPVK